ncbi:DUF5658 family protein [Tepidibacter hydrothermalis]|uniref:DUF5658 family protein n=1 Tax=Tepidibacter hydrothermalis TaxID=3036126 RepID=A0ABY8E877_9FIRM|nr:DUF5658 family protein [Tepidibacter hydrothermalis]WFD09031.1 DUF5658 family protein [Tepidibacter hydrothermalis]
MLLDYSITYYGINSLGIITEANPLMVGLVNLPFYKGFAIRIVISSIPVFLLKWAENKFIYPEAYTKLSAVVL